MSPMAFREPNEVLWRGVRPGHRGEQIAKYASANNATVILHTVTIGKTLFLTAVSFQAATTTAGKSGILLVRDTSDVEKYKLFNFYLTAVGGLSDSLSFNPPLEIPSGWDICIYSSATECVARTFIHGWEE